MRRFHHIPMQLPSELCLAAIAIACWWLALGPGAGENRGVSEFHPDPLRIRCKQYLTHLEDDQILSHLSSGRRKGLLPSEPLVRFQVVKPASASSRQGTRLS